MPAEMSMVVLAARDLATLRRYYQDLGWPERPGASDSLCTFDLGGVTLTLYPASPESESLIEDRPAVTMVVRVGARHEVDSACSAALRCGARAVVGPRDQPWGGRSGVVADPEGNRWEVLWVPSSPPAGPSSGPGPE